MEHDTGIERARPRAHAETVEGREAEAAVDAPSVAQGAQAGTAAQVGDDDALPRDLGRELRQDGRDVLVGEAVEAVPLHAGIADLAGERDQLGDGRLSAVEARVEAGDLRHAGEPLRDRVDRSQVVRLVKRRQREEPAELLHDPRRDEDGSVEPGPAVHHAVSDPEDARAAVPGAQPLGEGVEGRSSVTHRIAERLFHRSARAVLRGEAGRRADALDLAARVQAPSSARRPSVDAELQAGGARIQDEGVVVHGEVASVSAPSGAARAPPARRPRSSRSERARCRRGWSGSPARVLRARGRRCPRWPGR